MSRFPVADPADLPGDLRDRIGAIADGSGFVPNVFLGLAHRPAELPRLPRPSHALPDRPDGLAEAEREPAVVTTSGTDNRTYRVVAHGAILRTGNSADAVASNPWAVDLPARSRAIVDLAPTVALESATRAPTPTRPSPTTGSGTSARSPPGSPCPTAWHT